MRAWLMLGLAGMAYAVAGALETALDRASGAVGRIKRRWWRARQEWQLRSADPDREAFMRGFNTPVEDPRTIPTAFRQETADRLKRQAKDWKRRKKTLRAQAVEDAKAWVADVKARNVPATPADPLGIQCAASPSKGRRTKANGRPDH